MHKVLVDLHHAADIPDINILLGNPHAFRQLGVLMQVLLLAVNRNEIFRLGQALHEL